MYDNLTTLKHGKILNYLSEKAAEWLESQCAYHCMGPRLIQSICCNVHVCVCLSSCLRSQRDLDISYIE